MTAEYAGELVIDWPEPSELFRRPPAGWQVCVYEFQIGLGLEMLNDVTAIEVHASATSVVTAKVTRTRLTGDPDEPFAKETSTWLVVGFRMRDPAGVSR